MSNKEKEIAILRRKLERATQKLRHLEDQKEQTDHLLRLKAEEANQAEEKIKKLAEQIIHDARAPLSALGQFHGDALKYLNSEKQNSAIAAFSRLREIFKTLSIKYDELSGLDVAESYQSSDIEKIVKRIVEEKRNLFENDKEIHFDFNSEGSNLLANIQELELERIICNLLENSIDAIQAKAGDGTIKISVDRGEEDLFISIDDDGIGINPKYIEKIREYGVTTKKNGNGYGLYNAVQIVENRGGCLKIDSVPGKGTEILIVLREAENGNHLFLNKHGRLCIVDDDPLVHDSIDNFISSSNFEGELLHFDSEEEFRAWFDFYGSNQPEKNSFIVDGYIGPGNPRGPQLIKDLKITDQSILYTAHKNQFREMSGQINIFGKEQPISEILEIL